MNEKRTLLEKYSIPIEHLDFDYLRKCENVRELERIIEILRSGEEGYYPDLTNFAVDKLKEVDPDNRSLRNEVECQRTSMDERQQINVCYIANVICNFFTFLTENFLGICAKHQRKEQ